MAEDWSAIAAEVEDALKSIGQTDAGFEVTLRKQSRAGGSPSEPNSGATTYAYFTFHAVESMQRIRDRDGTLTGQIRRTLTVEATTGVTPEKGDKIAVNIAAAEAEVADPQPTWQEIEEVEPLAPAGVVILYALHMVR